MVLVSTHGTCLPGYLGRYEYRDAKVEHDEREVMKNARSRLGGTGSFG